MISKYIISNIYVVLFTLLSSLLISSNAMAKLSCLAPVKECIEGENEIRNIENMPVNPGCWKYRVTYECKEEADNNCQQLRDQGCSQIGAKCKTMLRDTCVVQDEVYKCPVERCDEIGNIACGKDIFCAQGGCTFTNQVKNNDFDKAVSSLAVLAEAAKDVKEQNTENPMIFAGRSMECSKNIAGAKNCCGISASGWGEGVFLNCADDEKELAKAKDAGRAIDIGEYCHNEVLGVCTSHHRVYCVFGSKIARIVQNEGRRNQLGIGFGEVGDDYAHPNCRGITNEELSRMDFGKMNFSELYKEIREKAKIPTETILRQKSGSYTHKELKEKSSKGKSVLSETSVGLKAAERIKEFYDKNIKK